MFQEFTLINPQDQCEVMVDIDTDTGKIVGLYCYADDIPAIENYETGKKEIDSALLEELEAFKYPTK